LSDRQSRRSLHHATFTLFLLRSCALVAILTHPYRANAGSRPVHEIAGSEFDYIVRRGDSLQSLASRYGVSVAVLAAANHLKRPFRLRPGEVLHIDNRHIPPEEIAHGILINVPQRMLFLFDSGKVISAYPVAVGRPTWQTKLGSFTVTSKVENPIWRVPRSIQREMAAAGKRVRTVVLPGSDNPLGHYALYLSIPGYRIHGTIAPSSIYTFQTHGCIRLHPDDIASLYRQVAVGETGEIVYEPSSLAVLPNGRIFIEVNKDVYHFGYDPWTALRAMAEINDTTKLINWPLVSTTIDRAEGIAREVDLGHGSHSAGLAADEQQSPTPPQALAAADPSQGGCGAR
jgi:L,D-transpeptidase ErfK/SrfK